MREIVLLAGYDGSESATEVFAERLYHITDEAMEEVQFSHRHEDLCYDTVPFITRKLLEGN